MTHIQPHPAPPEVVVVVPNKGGDDMGHVSVDKTGADTYVSSENESHLGGGGVGGMGGMGEGTGNAVLIHDAQTKGKWFEFLKTKQFYIILALGQVLSLCDVGTNTLTTLLNNEGTSIPAFQSLFNYILLTLIYTNYTIYKYGVKKWLRLILVDGWRFFILAFFDVEGNYFTVLAYRYTTILSASLIEFWAIAVVVIVSFIFLKVRYHWTQIVGILLCIGGLGVIFGSDHITGANNFGAIDQVKGDLFALVGATCYGLCNVLEEFFVSERPLYEVVGQLSFWAMLINGTQAGIFDRKAFQSATWNAKVGGYLTGYTLILSLFYSVAPVLLRLSSAAFLNISLLTINFWAVLIGLKVFHLHIHWMYPIAFVLILLGQVIYFLHQSFVGEARKPWLGENQERGHAGVGTAKKRVEHPEAIV